MSTTANEVREAALKSQKDKATRLGVDTQYQLWKETLPEGAMGDRESFDTYVNSQAIEEGAAEGRVSVSTGGADDVLRADVPTPGPDDEKTGPDEAGDTSEGGDDESGGLKLVEGMWQPPEEMEAENYEAPSTAAMTQSPEWIENAKKYYEFVGSPNKKGDQAAVQAEFGSQAFAPVHLMSDPPKAEPLTDEEIGAWARNRLSGFNWNVANTLNDAFEITSRNDAAASLAFLNLINMYDHSDGGAMDFAGALQELATDPTTYVGMGAGTVAAHGASKLVAKQGLKKAISMAIVGSTAGAVEGSMLAGGFDLSVQNIEQEAGAREDIDLGRAGKATAMGAGMGLLLGAGGGHLVGRRMDKLARLREDEMARLLGGEKVEADRELGMDDLVDMLRKSEEAAAKQGQTEQAAVLARRYVMDRGELPMKPDGSVDVEQVALDLIAMQREDGNKQTGQYLDSAIDVLNGEDISMHISRKEGAISIASTDQHAGPIKDVAEQMGLETSSVARADGFELTVKGDDRKLLEWIYEIHRTPTTNQQKAAAAAFKDAGIDIEVKQGRRGSDPDAANEPTFKQDYEPEPLSAEESKKFADRIGEAHARAEEGLTPRTPGFPGSTVKTVDGKSWEVLGKTKNGWFHLRNRMTGEEINQRRKGFTVEEANPAPAYAGPMELKPFTENAAKIIAMNEQVLNEPNKLKDVRITHKEQQALADELVEMGIDITNKKVAAHWAPHELMALRQMYNDQANGMANLARRLESDLRNNGRLPDEQLAMFNEAHTQFVATRDLFFGVSGNAARQLNILRSRPKDNVYEFSQSMMDSISLQGGRANTERAISLMADFYRKTDDGGTVKGISKMSDNIWGNQWSAALLNVRYNVMLSSWRTHFYNFLGNSASGVYQHLVVSPIRMGINNTAYAMDLARAVIDPKFAPDPADRMTRHQYFAELRGHFVGVRESLALAKEIALGRDIGEGKVWNELGLRYNVINVPTSMAGKAGTTPVRMLEAGDAFFKNQYFNSKIHELSSIKARYDEIYSGLDYKTQYQKYVDDPDAPMQREAQAFAQKQTYTNDPNVYGGVLAAVARGVAEAQNRSVAVNMVIPFVRTPANLLSYSMEMIGANTVLSPNKTYNAIMNGTQRESQEAMAKLTAAAGLWLLVGDMYQNGDITGTGPGNWEERKVWEAAGWQPNSAKIQGKWYSMERAAPAGQSLATIASVYDFYAMTEQQEKGVPEWIGAGLLYTADMILDESYLSSATDVLTAISSKEESRARSVTASIINSFVVPNLLRDFRRVTDETKRSSTSTNLLDQVYKQAVNASPWHSAELPPQRDWKGDIKNYYGNAYERALVPFNVRDPKESDPASMAIAYARIGVSTPDKSIVFSSATGDKIDLYAMDNGGGYVYDQYLMLVGQERNRAVNVLMATNAWHRLVASGQTGPGSQGEAELRKVLAIGTNAGRLKMMDFLISHSGDNNTYHRVGNEGQPMLYQIQHQVGVAQYRKIRQAIKNDVSMDELDFDTDQYLIEKPIEGPEFFKP